MQLALDIENLPTLKVEEWKYTNLSRVLPANLLLAEYPEEVVIHKNRGEVCEQSEEIVFTASDNQHTQPRLKIVLEEGAELTLLERQNGKGAYWKNMVTEIVVGKNAKLNHIRFCEDSTEGVQTNLMHITVERDACYECFALNMGGKLTRHQVRAEILGENADVTLNGLNLLNGEQTGDTTILIEHKAPHCTSNQFYRTLLDGQAKGVFQGKVHVHKIAQKTDAYQLANTLLLSDKAEMNTKPELEIYADDVKCSHGSTTGQLNEEPLFYLRSRGLSEEEARMLLVQAFVGEVVDKIVDKIVDEDVKTAVEEKVQLWLRSALLRI